MSRALASVIFVALLTGAMPAQSTRDITFAEIAHPRRGEWPSYNGLMSANRHSPLDEINAGNVATLEQTWVHDMGGKRALQMTPLVVDGVMYAAAVNEVRALDAKTGRQLWQFVRPQTPGLVPTGDPASGINRAIAVLGNRVFLQTDHAHLLAVDRRTGELLWDVEMADYRQNYGATGALLVVNDLVIAGISAGDEGVRGFLDAYRASTGERVWRFWTVPARGEPGSETWIGKAIEHGCATTWLTGSYDPAANLLYWPTGNPCPDYNGDERQGDNLYSSSVIALDPATGTRRWHFQFTPHDLHDWDANQPPMLVDAEFGGRPRKLLVLASRNGFFYVLDRLTGQMLMAEPFVKNLTWASGIDPGGRPKLLPGNENSPDGTVTCPAVSGAANWPSSAFSPATGFFYVMASEACAVYRKNADWFELGKSFYGGTTKPATIEGGGKFLRALDLQSGKVVWEIPKIGGGATASGLLSTAGGLVFYGDNTGGALVAVDSKTGQRMWQFETRETWKSSPMTFAVDGNQYIGVVAGSTVRVFSLPRQVS
jgi:alcohol dehydrogenase (cytochrome c)